MDINLHKVAVVLQAGVEKLRKAEVLQGLVPQEIKKKKRKKEWGGGMEELGKAEDLQGCQHPALQKL